MSPQIIRALFFALDELRAVVEKVNQGLAWSEEEDKPLAERFNEGIKIIQLAKIHSRTYGAIKLDSSNSNSFRNIKAQQFLKLLWL